MIENTSTLYKMIILYMLKKVTFPLSNSQITNFLLDHEYTTYFHIQQTIHDLMDTHLILERKRGKTAKRGLPSLVQFLILQHNLRMLERIVVDEPVHFSAHRQSCVNVKSAR